MLSRMEVGSAGGVKDARGGKVRRAIAQELGIELEEVRVIKVFTIQGLESKALDEALSLGVLHDPVLQKASLKPLAREFDYVLEVGFRPGVTDNEGRTARETLRTAMGAQASKDLAVYTSDQYLLTGSVEEEDVHRIARDLLANELIQRYQVKSLAQWTESPGFTPRAAQVTGEPLDTVATVALTAMSDAELVDFSRANTLALSLKELHAIRAYYADETVAARRAGAGLPPEPTDAEVEVLAQTWSEHCKHKIFNAKISHTDKETGESRVIDSLFDTYIKGSTDAIRAELGPSDFCLSVFKDNAGVIRFSDELSVCIKVETHNSPSALDPYGGALTGIVGVNRDPMGTGMGANLVCNTDVFCFASPFYKGELPPRLLHPRRVMEGVREGVEHGGNKSGIPTVNGSVVFDERYLGKPLVYCGTIGSMPAKVAGRPSHEKRAEPGDHIVMTGGRIGKDGIHGATFSSEELHEGSPATAVQIGDPITQRRMYDFIMRARDLGMYNAITDNGAGGLSSSVGEMAEDSGGCVMDLAKAPLKYDGLMPWEILVSEAQERMTLAVPPGKLGEFMDLAREMGVEATDLGEFTDSGYFDVRFRDKPVAFLEMRFLHHGVPQMELSSEWKRPVVQATDRPQVRSHGDLLKRMLGRLNICSKEYMVRQYDHEVQGGSAVKPMVGAKGDGPSDAGALRPDLASQKGLVVSHGICPRYGDLDAYWMMAMAIDEAVRNNVAVGGNPDHWAGVDNFCWCDPVAAPENPDGEYKLAQLVRANQALDRFCRAYRLPCVSGKDSMKNDYKGGGKRISIPPTVLFSVLSVVDDVGRCATSDFKRPGDLIYLLGETRAELGAGEVADELGFVSDAPPTVDPEAALAVYRKVHKALSQGLANAAHDLSDGGLAVALAEMALGGRLGAVVDLAPLPASTGGLSVLDMLYSESGGRLLVTVDPKKREDFEGLFAGLPMGLIGAVQELDRLEVRNGQDLLMEEPVEDLARAFKAVLDW